MDSRPPAAGCTGARDEVKDSGYQNHEYDDAALLLRDTEASCH